MISIIKEQLACVVSLKNTDLTDLSCVRADACVASRRLQL